MTWAVHHGDIVDVLRDEPANSFDAVLCDPPYGLSFMGRKWDYQVPSVALWESVLRVLKPGAPLIAFSGTRTYHRTVVAIEDAGFEIRDCLAWMYGSGFPKSLDVSKAIDAKAGAVREVQSERVTGWSGTLGGGATLGGLSKPDVRRVTVPASAASAAWDGYGTSLKPAFEPACLARKPLEGTVASNVQRWGVGALAIDACRIGRTNGDRTEYGRDTEIASSPSVAMGAFRAATPYAPDPCGRWPANVLFDEEAAAVLDAQSGDRPGMSSGGTGRTDASMFGVGGITKLETVRGDNGGASRFFYVAKASREERDLGCEHLPHRSAAESASNARRTSSRSQGPGSRSQRATRGPSSRSRNEARGDSTRGRSTCSGGLAHDPPPSGRDDRGDLAKDRAPAWRPAQPRPRAGLPDLLRRGSGDDRRGRRDGARSRRLWHAADDEHHRRGDDMRTPMHTDVIRQMSERAGLLASRELLSEVEIVGGSPIEQVFVATMFAHGWRSGFGMGADSDLRSRDALRESGLGVSDRARVFANGWPFIDTVGVAQPKLELPDRLIRPDFAFVWRGDEHATKVIVELDGHDFHERTPEQAQSDKSRDRHLQTLGWKVLRFTGREVLRAPRACLHEVERLAAQASYAAAERTYPALEQIQEIEP